MDRGSDSGLSMSNAGARADGLGLAFSSLLVNK